MLQAKRKSDGQIVAAYFESNRNGPFSCLECGDRVILKVGKRKVNHFAHANPLACRYADNESDAHRRCKIEIFEALRTLPGVSEAALEKQMGTVRPDVWAFIKGVPVAVEVQISSLSVETIMARTIDYYQRGIYVLWLLQWAPALDGERYAPKIWEKWVHAAYYGRVYYWLKGLEVASYRFEPSLKSVPRKTWHDVNGKKVTVGGYSMRSKRHRTPVREGTFNIATDFVPKERLWWQGEGFAVPDATLFSQKRN
ncbi:MAG TPA: competence protein CoiA family protein [Verrucomicrobiae bacterium]|nr:competence protein CoiA family protein [Verrucomicrobiae bacterium]